MYSVFIGGSRAISRLNIDIIKRIDNVIANNYRVLVGDANGADKAIQGYLLKNKYSDVIVYCSSEKPRNNLGDWPIYSLKSEITKRMSGRSFHMVKDEKMASDCDYGFMLWDCKSPGSLNNILNLVERNKKCLVYLSISKSFIVFDNLMQIKDYIMSLENSLVKEFNDKINLIDRLQGKYEDIQIKIAL